MYGECRHSLSWTSRAIKTYFSFKVISFIAGNKLSNSVKAFLVLYIIWLLFFYKNIGFRRFRGLLIRSSVTPTSARRNNETVILTVMLVWTWPKLFKIRKIVIFGLIRNAAFLLHVCQWYSYRSVRTYRNCLLKDIFREKKSKINTPPSIKFYFNSLCNLAQSARVTGNSWLLKHEIRSI